jgi:hypothetical protein
MIARWKGILKDIHFGGSIEKSYIIEVLNPQKNSFRPSKWPGSLGTEKLLKIVSCQKTVLSQLE